MTHDATDTITPAHATDPAPRRASAAEVPVLDLRPLMEGGDLRPLADALRKACCDTAFFYIRNHGIPRDTVANTIAASHRFFGAPDAVRLGVTRNRFNRGYLPIGTTRVPGREPDLKDSFDLGVDLPLDHPDVVAGLPLHGPNLWPDLPGFRAPVEAYFDAVKATGLSLMRVFALALELDEDFFESRFERPNVSMRMLHYPRPETNPAARGVGSGAHTDYGMVTVLYQDPAGGLELQKPDGEWIAAPFIEDTLVVNLGDLFPRWTNDLFRSNPHRVINRTGRERFSIATFINPTYGETVECLPTCCGPDNPPKYPPVGAGAFIAAKVAKNQQLPGVMM